jgi:DNA-binding NtrC family response regulator
MQRATLFSSTLGRITREALGLAVEPAATSLVLGETSLKEAERTLILNALERNPGDRAAAAKSLGMTRSSFYRRISRLGIKLGR